MNMKAALAIVALTRVAAAATKCLELVVEAPGGGRYAISAQQEIVANGTFERTTTSQIEEVCVDDDDHSACYAIDVTTTSEWRLEEAATNRTIVASSSTSGSGSFFSAADGGSFVAAASCRPLRTTALEPTKTTLFATASCRSYECSVELTFDTASFGDAILWAALTVDLVGDFGVAKEYAIVAINGEIFGLCGEDFTNDCERGTCTSLTARDVTAFARTGTIALRFTPNSDVDVFCGDEGNLLLADATLDLELSHTTYPTQAPTTSALPTTADFPRVLTGSARCYEFDCVLDITFDTSFHNEYIAAATLAVDLQSNFGPLGRRASVLLNGAAFDACAPDATCVSSRCFERSGADVTAAARTGTLRLSFSIVPLIDTPRVDFSCPGGHLMQADATLSLLFAETAFPTPSSGHVVAVTPLPSVAPAPTKFPEPTLTPTAALTTFAALQSSLGVVRAHPTTTTTLGTSTTRRLQTRRILATSTNRQRRTRSGTWEASNRSQQKMTLAISTKRRRQRLTRSATSDPRRRRKTCSAIWDHPRRRRKTRHRRCRSGAFRWSFPRTTTRWT